jgi:N-acetylglucosamine-6-phosphate deacetylase
LYGIFISTSAELIILGTDRGNKEIFTRANNLINKGFIDLHTHGIGKYDTRTSSPEHILKMAELHAAAGNRAILPAIYPSSIEEMRKNIEAVRRAMEMQEADTGMHPSSEILGVYLEGPFLNPLKCGSLCKKMFIKPDLISLKRLIAGYEDIIKIITIAPELNGALKLIERCAGIGVRVNMGHSDATFKQAISGKKAGATGVTHIFNAMGFFHHREPGLAGMGLLDRDLYIEIISDGIHLHPKTLELIFRLKPADRIIIVSDSVKGSDAGKGAVYNKKGILKGSLRTISDAVNILKSAGIGDAKAVLASKDNPARYANFTK